MKAFFLHLISFLFPETCVVCGKGNVSVCEKCLQNFPLAPYQEDPWVHSLFSYQDHGVRNAIHALKFKHMRSVADCFAPLMHEAIQEIQATNIALHEQMKIALLPVPKMKAHVRVRGFDAMEYLCNKIHEQDPLRYKVCGNAVVRLNTKAQTGLTRKERLVNMQDAFQVVMPEMLANQTIYIIDDVTTTGSTLRELEKACLQVGAKKVRAVTIAH